MAWWNIVFDKITQGQILQTPGRGLDGGSKKKDFLIYEKRVDKINVISGATKVPLIPECFNSIEIFFQNHPGGYLRVAALHDNEAFENSADKLIREATGSQLARSNYVCSILVYCHLPSYAMQGNRKVVVLPQ